MASKPPKKPSSIPPQPVPAAIPVYSDFEQRWPNLHSLLFSERYEDGTRRQTASLVFFVERGQLKMVINDNDNQLAAFKTIPGLVEGLDLVEEELDEERLEWRKKRSR